MFYVFGFKFQVQFFCHESGRIPLSLKEILPVYILTEPRYLASVFLRSLCHNNFITFCLIPSFVEHYLEDDKQCMTPKDI